ncbi:Coenzyme F420 hydrogenase/dehydrogenase, beta subunit C-terminal domain [Methanosalsum natronophilum]|uniref:Coenzyme F420 hydrogenase/dehydrogenase, beta subunit C-terminal domain n=1 Tax=Methanosalsum natronophilum TaxID=768733 RepID=UPI0021698C21|nr:Coenzyme F420 hydrogenase/dehydrogenase, beta subunit C-terminal domain [Methanosalsum natronophilum]MCS3924038.1 formate dehydrogenase subunit beta [Methanosalsum natronophilum]
MIFTGTKIYAWSREDTLKQSGEYGGAVTTLLKYALENSFVDGVLNVHQGMDIYDATVELIESPEKICSSSGSLHCGTLLISKVVKEVLDKTNHKKLAVVVKGCDLMSLIEMEKRGVIDLNKTLLIGLNCGGTITPKTAIDMIENKFGIEHSSVVNEKISKGHFLVFTKNGETHSLPIDELEDEGYGRRTNCRRCSYKIPRSADLACGNWGVIGEMAGKSTFIEVCSHLGATLVSNAIRDDVIETADVPKKGIEIREKIEQSMISLSSKWRNENLATLSSNTWGIIEKETNRCIKCYACIDRCPVCFKIKEEIKENTTMVPNGEVPPNPMFHIKRFSHISDSCVNCGQCEELCPMDIPLSLFSHSIRIELDATYNPKLGKPPYKN